MKTRITLAVVIIIAAIAGAVVISGRSGDVPEQLVPAWQLLETGAYSCTTLGDPFISWSPDSKTVVLSAFPTASRMDTIYKWTVGDKSTVKVCLGSTPSFISANEIIYLNQDPKRITARNLTTGAEREFAPAVAATEFWKEATGFVYNAAHRSIILRLANMTDFRDPGTEEYDLNGKSLGEIGTRMSEGIADFSHDPSGSQCALLVKETDAAPVSLQLAKGNKRRGKVIDSGQLGAVAWSPDGKLVAYGKAAQVIAFWPSDGKRMVIGSFANPKDTTEQRAVRRLSWSPDGRYLAVLVYVSKQAGDYPLVYVLDTSALRGTVQG